MDNFPGNSHSAKSKPQKNPDDKNIERVITTPVMQRKKTFGQKFKDAFIGGEFRSASTYILAEVLLPALRNTIVDATSKGIERMIYGDVTPRSHNNYGNNRPRISYDSPLHPMSPQHRAYLPHQPGPGKRQQFNDIVLTSRAEAELIIERMGDIIENYEYASISDLKHLIGERSNYVDKTWGWSSINFVDIRQIREGWLISFPSAEPI